MREWVFKHEPRNVSELVMSNEKKELLKTTIKNLPNSILHGPPGTGKGCSMNILIKETGYSFLKVNASMENSVDDVRGKIQRFARSYDINKKIVYLNEAERMRSDDGQKTLLQLIEDTEGITRYFFVVNNINKIIPELKSRCANVIGFSDPPAKEIYKRCVDILDKEGVSLQSKQSLVDLIKNCYPDIRKIIGILQSNTSNGIIKDISYSATEDLFEKIFSFMQKKDIENVRKILKSNYIQYDNLYNFLYKKIVEDPDVSKKPGEFIIYIGEALFRNSSVAIQEVNFMWMFFNMMKEDII